MSQDNPGGGCAGRTPTRDPTGGSPPDLKDVMRRASEKIRSPPRVEGS
ncbi:protease modulator HflK N-terminal domain-containing protein [Aminithiophilus ramosus]|uniref:Protease modulator HflK N-terminal domain-containing protein n=1 Tax=Aminithiophilus ramosus TaxID=3029084 RepID=A0A9Q7AQV6_9BACT|nr:protease modulator HflK N-terminal domain-containing protein [Aminithiophilus ramosus]